MTYTMRYHTPAEDSVKGWEEQSLPLGCGWFGANVFGIPTRERIQITENSLLDKSGLGNFAEIYITFPHEAITDYERGLRLDDGVAYTSYCCNGVRYEREYFTSYPDRCMGIRLTGVGLSFVLAPEIPFIKDYNKEPGDGGGKSGIVTSEGANRIRLTGHANYYNLDFGALMQVDTDGSLTNENGRITVANATWAEIRFVCATDYVLCTKAFSAPDRGDKTDKSIDVPALVTKLLEDSLTYTYTELKARHTADFASLFGRVSFTLAGADDTADTADMLSAYGKGNKNPYLEMLYFQYGRYLLISSSRSGTLPANLQGTWNCHDLSPWGSGYWHNINVQMNYWPAFSTNLAETFEAYRTFNEAFRPAAAREAYRYLRHWNPENVTTDDEKRFPETYGWTVGTAVYPYFVTGPGGHSGPGTGGLTTKLFADWYDFTLDDTVLREAAYPALASMSRYLTKTVRNYDGEYLASFSASPEQLIGGHWSKTNIYYNTVGCAFDQQMIYENGLDMLRLADICGIDDQDTAVQRAQIDHYSPVQVGWSGQIKEYREENLYGEIGEYNHRHISQLMALYPGSLINHTTPAWLDAAKVSLNERTDYSTGWALAHRLNAWARTGDGNRAYRLFSNLIGTRTLQNLWDTHPPFQIDGNFGGTSGVAEMLLQSHEGYIAILPALPDAWKTGSFTGLCARGAFTVSVSWQDGTVVEIAIRSGAGQRCRLRYSELDKAVVDGCANVDREPDMLSFDTVPGGIYKITGIPVHVTAPVPENLQADRETMTLTWDAVENGVYNVYCAVDDDKCYTKLVTGLTETTWQDTLDIGTVGHVTYKVTATFADGTGESDGVNVVLNHASKLYLERYAHIIRQLDSAK